MATSNNRNAKITQLVTKFVSAMVRRIIVSFSAPPISVCFLRSCGSKRGNAHIPKHSMPPIKPSKLAGAGKFSVPNSASTSIWNASIKPKIRPGAKISIQTLSITGLEKSSCSGSDKSGWLSIGAFLGRIKSGPCRASTI